MYVSSIHVCRCSRHLYGVGRDEIFNAIICSFEKQSTYALHIYMHIFIRLYGYGYTSVIIHLSVFVFICMYVNIYKTLTAKLSLTEACVLTLLFCMWKARIRQGTGLSYMFGVCIMREFAYVHKNTGIRIHVFELM